MIPEKNWSESQNKWEKFGKKAKYAVFHGVTREPGNVLKEVETSERVGGGGEGTPVSSDRDDRMGAKIIIIIIIIIINY